MRERALRAGTRVSTHEVGVCVREDGQESECKKGSIHEKAQKSEKESTQQRESTPSVYKRVFFAD